MIMMIVIVVNVYNGKPMLIEGPLLIEIKCWLKYLNYNRGTDPTLMDL